MRAVIKYPFKWIARCLNNLILGVHNNEHRIEFTTTSDKVGYSLISFTGCQCLSNNAKKLKTLFSTKGFCSAMYKKMPRRRQSAGWLPESLLLLCGICHFRFSSCNGHYMHLNTCPAAMWCCWWYVVRLADPPTEAGDAQASRRHCTIIPGHLGNS